MTTAQEGRQAAVRGFTGTSLDYNGDWEALFDLNGISPEGGFNGRFLAWINLALGTSYTELNGAMAAYAAANGAVNWSSLGTVVQGGGGSIPLQIVATRGVLPGNENNGPTNTAAHTRGDSRILVFTGKVAATDIRAVFSNFKKAGGVNEQDGPNAITVDGGLEIAGVNYRTNFSGSATKAIAANDASQQANISTLATLPADTSFYLRSSVSVGALGQTWARSQRNNFDGTGFVENASTSQAGNTGALTTGGGNARTMGYVPRALIGRPASPMPAIWVIGDSNSYGFGETSPSYTPDANGAYGFIPRGLESVGGHAVPHVIDARGGDRLQDCLPANNPRQWEMAQYGTHAFVALGTNDVNNNLATMQGYFTTIATEAKNRVLRKKVYAITIPARTSDATNTAVVSGYEVGGKYDQFNAWLKTQIGVLIDGVIDPNNGTYNIGAGDVAVNSGCKDPATGLWKDISYQIDGTHYSAAGAVIAGAVVNATAATFS